MHQDHLVHLVQTRQTDAILNCEHVIRLSGIPESFIFYIEYLQRLENGGGHVNIVYIRIIID